MPMCAMFGCRSNSKSSPQQQSNTEPNVGLHCLPKVITRQCERTKVLSEKRRSLWLARIHRKDLKNLDNVRVCGRHFITGKPSALMDDTNPDWVPTQHLGYERSEQPPASRFQRSKKCQKKRALTATASTEFCQSLENNAPLPDCTMDSQPDGFPSSSCMLDSAACSKDAAMQTELAMQDLRAVEAENRRLASELRSLAKRKAHFRPCDYKQNRLDNWKKPKPDAVPTQPPSRRESKQKKKPVMQRRSKSIPSVPARPENNCDLSTLCEVSLHLLEDSAEAESTEIPSTSLPSSAVDLHNLHKDVLAAGDSSSSSPPILSRRESNPSVPSAKPSNLPASSECAELRRQLVNVMRKNADLQEYCERAKKDMSCLRMKVGVLETELQNLKYGMKFLNEDQLQALLGDSVQGFIWSANTIKQALQIKDTCGKAGYETLRNLGYPLPSISTLDRRLQSQSSFSGILLETFDVLKCKTEGMEDTENDYILFVDKMEIAQVVECHLGSVQHSERLEKSKLHLNV